MQDIYAPKRKVILLTGNYGSGKSEISVNYAMKLAAIHPEVKVVDLDIINPYFRCREATELLERMGISVIIPEGEQRYADLPIIVPEIKGVIQNSTGYTILDVGGEDTGARVLSYLSEAFEGMKEYEFLVVINSNRPFTSEAEGAIRILRSIEKASRLTVTGLVSNAHLLEETTLDVVMAGYELTLQVSRQTRIPIFFVTVPESLSSQAAEKIDVPVFPIKRVLLPPHLKHRILV